MRLNMNLTSGPQNSICQKKAMGRFFATVVSQAGMKPMRPGFWNMRVAQKLMIGHIIETVTPAL